MSRTGSSSRTSKLAPSLREWIAEHTLHWQGGWLFWFAVTLSFAWSHFALGRHLEATLPWPSLAIGVALIATAVDLVGVLVNATFLPELACDDRYSCRSGSGAAGFFHLEESLADALANVVAFGLCSFAGLPLLPAVSAAPSCLR